MTDIIRVFVYMCVRFITSVSIFTIFHIKCQIRIKLVEYTLVRSFLYIVVAICYEYEFDDTKGVIRNLKLMAFRFRFMVFNATFNTISVISWRSVLLVEETGIPGENHRPAASHWQLLSHNDVSNRMPLAISGIRNQKP